MNVSSKQEAYTAKSHTISPKLLIIYTSQFLSLDIRKPFTQKQIYLLSSYLFCTNSLVPPQFCLQGDKTSSIIMCLFSITVNKTGYLTAEILCLILI